MNFGTLGFPTGLGLFGVPLTSNIWTPKNIKTELWLDASDITTITLNLGNVSEWRDKSGNNRNAIQTNSTNRPLFVNSSLNGLSGIIFNGSTSWFNDISTYTGQFFIALCQRDATKAFAGLHTASASELILDNTGNNIISYGSNISYVNGSISTTVTVLSPFIWGFKLDIPNTSSRTLGQEFNSRGATRAWQGICWELIALSSYPDDFTRQKLEGYLAYKWGLISILPNNHPYKNILPN
jgi:hypothetical protein